MVTLIGLLLDVSSTMQSGVGFEGETDTWAYSLLSFASDLIRYDVSKSNQIFVVGVGAKNDAEIIDVVRTIRECQNENGEINVEYVNTPATGETTDNIFKVLESNGARSIRKWADKRVVEISFSEYLAQLILRKLTTDKTFTRKFVREDLPLACRSWDTAPFGAFFQRKVADVATKFRRATPEDIQTVIGKALLKDFGDQSIFSVKDAAHVFRGCIGRSSLTEARLNLLLKIIEPFIYGRTPLYSALNETSGVFLRSLNTFPNHRKVLCIVSDGFPTDEGHMEDIQTQFRTANVTVFGCYVSDYSYVEPRRLYSSSDQKWEDGAKFLFNLSSNIPSSLITRAIFLKYGWAIDVTNNETKLFLHVNDPNHLSDACNIAKNAICSQDALSDLLVSVSLDIYINDKNTNIKAHRQVGGTCYANASAAVLHLAMHRILGREDGYPDFEFVRKDLIRRHGTEGANTFSVLKEVCPLYRLQCQQVDTDGAMDAIAAKRPVVARFRLTDEEWETFGTFFKKNRYGILKQRDLDIKRRAPDAETGGHAVVLTSYNSECLRLMNSWGDCWADMGFFRIENAEVLDLDFIDVFWTLNDLSEREKKYYSKHGSHVAKDLMKSLKALQVAKFTCCRCGKTSSITNFRGTMSRVTCPKCSCEFSPVDGNGNILALNMYLTSLCI
ncbi:uncharacterized protein LOC123531864 [Mercenaria mercenaria]|uniref:uncharacterized protein LOC123531864 n=1 Tax=Mercenaria mercenaria TaxID=6596 RepID=UPI00234ECB90|nr:uncharacterized protein LOC123531864 [Mercenaria mercenaria]